MNPNTFTLYLIIKVNAGFYFKSGLKLESDYSTFPKYILFSMMQMFYVGDTKKNNISTNAAVRCLSHDFNL